MKILRMDWSTSQTEVRIPGVRMTISRMKHLPDWNESEIIAERFMIYFLTYIMKVEPGLASYCTYIVPRAPVPLCPRAPCPLPSLSFTYFPVPCPDRCCRPQSPFTFFMTRSLWKNEVGMGYTLSNGIIKFVIKPQRSETLLLARQVFVQYVR
jgi:hypothetical protein